MWWVWSLDVRLRLHQRPALGENRLHLLLQSPDPSLHGPRRWRLPICRHGDVPLDLLVVFVSGGGVDKYGASRDRDDLTGHHWLVLGEGEGKRKNRK